MTWPQEWQNKYTQLAMLTTTNQLFLLFFLTVSGLLFPTLIQGNTLNPLIKNDNCLANISNNKITQVELATACPKIYLAIQQNGLAQSLVSDLPEQISLQQLKLLQSAIKPKSSEIFLNQSNLDSLLAEIYTSKPDELTFNAWDQFLNWLKTFKVEKYENQFNWLADFLEKITPSKETAVIMLYSICGLLVLLTLGMIIWELYLADVFIGKKRRHKQNLQPEQYFDNTSKELSLLEIKQLNPALQTISLLKVVITHLTTGGRLPKNTCLSNQQLKHYLQNNNSLLTQPFSTLLTDVEPVLYGELTPSDQAVQRCWQNAEEILAQ